MKIKTTLLFLLLSLAVFGAEVPVEKAEKVAKNFLSSNSSSLIKSAQDLQLSLVTNDSRVHFSSIRKTNQVEDQLFYVFNINDTDGYIIIAGDDNATPILGYSDSGSFSFENMPSNVAKWLEGYKNEIRYIKTNPEQANPDNIKKWDRLLSGGNYSNKKSVSTVAPLISSTWNQSPYYNDLCPYDANASELTVTGCAATAMAQIMNYWEYPLKGSGFHSYNHDVYGTLSANFGEKNYDWASMPDVVNSTNEAVATLMYHCGVSIDMNYGIASEGGSGAYLLIEHSPIQHCVEYALTTYFNYDNSVQGVFRSDYSDNAWISLLKDELNNGRPIEYAGFGSGGGHAFVCDGFDSNDFFHFNWGWSGYYDGYFAIDALDPQGTGIGGGSGGYNSGHQAIIGIKPPDSFENYNLALYANLSISEDPLFYTSPYTIHTDIANYGTTTFSGDFGIAVFDNELNFVEFTEILEGASLEASMHYIDGIDFTNSGSLNLLPGKYYAAACYRSTESNWIFVDDGSYNNIIEFEVYYSNDIELYQDFVISCGEEIVQEEAFTITLDIINDGETTFSGDFEVGLYNMEGDFIATIQTLTGASLEAGYYYNDLVFSSDGLSVDPGTYLLALTHKEDGGDWYLTGSSYYTNPVRIVVKHAPYTPDMYEENDTESDAYELSAVFTNNTASVNTSGSNSHIGTDEDFYRLTLESGYDYTITARVHDAYNSDNQEIYTNDVLWAFDAHGYWSEVYDDVISGEIEVKNGGEIVFGVAPYFEGETGTYLLDIQITRSEIVSVDTESSYRLSVYPNPTTDFISVNSTSTIDSYSIYDIQGRLLQTKNINKCQETLNVSELKPGSYYLEIVQDGISTIQKIIKR